MIELPDFININTDSGLRHLAGNKKLYLKILKDFHTNYKSIKLEGLDDNEFQRLTHTIKGLSANIGAESLFSITKKLDETQDRSLIPQFYDELKKVFDELKEKLKVETNKIETGKEDIPFKVRDELLDRLKNGIERERTQICRPVIKELFKYKLSNKDHEILEQIKGSIDEFDFDEALENFMKIL